MPISVHLCKGVAMERPSFASNIHQIWPEFFLEVGFEKKMFFHHTFHGFKNKSLKFAEIILPRDHEFSI